MNNLAQKHCIPCEGGAKPITKEEAQTFALDVPGWTLSDDAKAIHRDVVFKDFKEAVVFVNKVADVAESEGHHPDIDIRWNKVHLELFTHAVGGLTENDFILAGKIDTLS